VLHELYTALEETLDDADDALITPTLLESCFTKIEMQVKRLLASRQERLDQKADEDIEEEDLELLDEAEEQEEELLQQARFTTSLMTPVASHGSTCDGVWHASLPTTALIQE
jgi:Importin repeat 6